MPLRTLVHRVLQTILPARCPVTGDVVDRPGLVAPAVWGRLDFIAEPLCAICGIRFDLPVDPGTVCPNCLADPPPFTQARSVFAYDDISREMILRFKHGDQTHLITAFLPWMRAAAGDMRAGVDIIIPVPLHPWRLIARRYNQAAILARALARDWGVPMLPQGLKRVRRTASQGHMTRAQRTQNVSGAFRVPPAARAALAGKTVLLIDDVYTTGATILACCHALKQAGVGQIRVLTLARVIRGQVL